MELKIIQVNKTTAELRLLNGEVVLDMLIIPIDIHFNTVLVTSIDKILKKNRIEKVSLEDTTLEGFDDESSMVFLIVRTVVEALKIK